MKKEHFLPLHIKYRPKDLSEIIGHAAIVASIKSILDRPAFQTFLFVGPSGVGKTTLARILGHSLGCDDSNIIETAAAQHNKVESVRALLDTVQYKTFESQKMIILDECHVLTKQAWDALLQVTEEPPEGVNFAFCTTEESKVPKAMVSRSAVYRLSYLSTLEIEDILDWVCEEEHIELTKSEIRKISLASQGNARNALIYLAQVRDIDTEANLDFLLSIPVEGKGIIDLCRLLITPQNVLNKWADALKILNSPEIQKGSAEGHRIVIMNYMAKVLLNTQQVEKAGSVLDIMLRFSDSYPQELGQAFLIRDCADVILGDTNGN